MIQTVIFDIGRVLGFRTVHFENYQQAHEAMEKLLKSDGEADE